MTVLNPRSHDPPVQVSLQFEEGRPSAESVFENAATKAKQIIQQCPLAAPQFPFFDSRNAADWFLGKSLDTGITSDSSKKATRRLRAITCGAETLLEHSYGADGLMISTCYQDGETVLYEWDSTTRTRRVRCKSGNEVTTRFRSDDLPESISYNRATQFSYDYDVNGNIRQINYPDALRMERSFNHRLQLTTVVCPTVRTEFKWKDSGKLESYSLSAGGKAFEFHADAKSHRCDVTSESTALGPSVVSLFHSFGIWRISQKSSTDEMLTPWGDRFRVVARAQDRPAVVWSPSGEKRFEYEQSGIPKAIVYPDGARSLFYHLKEQNRAILVSPTGLISIGFDELGRLCKTLAYDGDYTLLNYAPDGSLNRIATFIETIDICAANRSHSYWFNASGGYACKLTFSPEGQMQRLDATGLRANTVKELCRMLDFLWRWLALRTPFGIAMP